MNESESSFNTTENLVTVSKSTNTRKRQNLERTRWSNRQKSLNLSEFIDAPPQLSPIPKKKRHENLSFPILEKEVSLFQDPSCSKEAFPSTSNENKLTGIKLEHGSIKCNLCEKTFKSRPSFNSHRINMHNIVVRVSSNSRSIIYIF